MESSSSEIETAFPAKGAGTSPPPIDPFPRPGLVFILGTLGSRKTWLGLNLAVSAATGSRWPAVGPNRRCPLPLTPSLFIDYELGGRLLWSHARSVLLAQNAGKDARFHFTSHPEFDLHAIFPTAAALEAGFVVLDSPWGLGAFQSPDAVYANRKAFSILKALSAKANTCLVILQHTRKRRTSIGNALLAAGAHHVLAVDAPFGQPLVHLRTTSSVPGIAPLSITARGPFTPYKLPRSKDFKPPHTLGNAGYQLLDFLNTNGQSSTKELMQTISFAVPARVPILIHELVRDGFVRRSNPGSRGTSAIYQITPAGSAVLSSYYEGVARLHG